MRVVHIASTDVGGGGAIAARRLHCSLNATGIRSTMFVGLAAKSDPSVVQFNPSVFGPSIAGRVIYKVARRLQRRVRLADGSYFSLDWTILAQLPLHQIPLADIYHLHWTTDLLDFRMLPRLARRAPLVWTFHDMNPFTGGCHYDRGCGRFANRCGACPMTKSSNLRDLSWRSLERKRKVLVCLDPSRFTVVSPSQWMAEQVHRSSLFGRFRLFVIPNGVDLEDFRPSSKEAARRRFNLASADRVVLFVADKLKDQRKGWSYLERAITSLPQLSNFRVITVGKSDANSLSTPKVRHLGRLEDQSALRDAYNAADLVVIPSLQDNFPNTVLESLACGTPIVGFATGGIVDAVEHGVSGLLVPPHDTRELSTCIAVLLSDEALRRSMGAAARDRAVSCYGLEQQAAAHTRLYEDMLDSRHSPGAPLVAR